LKTKNTGSKSVNLKVASKSPSSSKATSASKTGKKTAPRGASTLKAVNAKKQPHLKVAKAKPEKAVALTVAQRITSAKLAKNSDAVAKNSKSKLKLVKSNEASIPATKITRSAPTSPGSRVVSGAFGIESPAPTKPVLAVRTSLEKSVEKVVGVAGEMAFKVGDKIVYPGHGVGEIEGVRTTNLGGQDHHIYNIKILDSGMKVMVPVSQATSVGLRRIVDKKEIDRVFDILRDRDFKIDTQTWNRRFREYSQKIKTGSVYEIAIVLRDLSVLSADKELSFGEKKMLDMAEALLVSEIAIARARPADKVVGELRALFA
jgi:CarD family transcriptional regulator